MLKREGTAGISKRQRAAITRYIVGCSKLACDPNIILPARAIEDPRWRDVLGRFSSLPPELHTMILQYIDRGLFYSLTIVQYGFAAMFDSLPKTWATDVKLRRPSFSNINQLKAIRLLNAKYLSNHGRTIPQGCDQSTNDITGIEVAFDKVGVQKLTFYMHAQPKKTVFDGTTGYYGLQHTYFPIERGNSTGLVGTSDVGDCAY